MDRRRSPGGAPPPPRRERPYPPHDHEGRDGPMREPRLYRGDPRDMRERPRRPRSQSPTYERYPAPRGTRMSPPPFKRYRREDDFYERTGPPGSPDYGPPRSPPPDRRRDDRMPYRDEARPPPPHGRPTDPQEPLTFKKFLLMEVEDDAEPEEAQARYQAYLEQFYGSKIRADFESKKNTEGMKKKYDPRYFQEAVKRRNEEAAAAAKQFQQDLAAGKYNPQEDSFNQGADPSLPPRPAPAPQENGKAGGAEEGAEGGSSEGASAPVVCYKASRVATDYKVAQLLVAKLDAEKGIEGSQLVPGGSGAAGKDGDQAMETDGEKVEGNGAVVEEPEVTAENVGEYLGKLDVLLTYLYAVHAVDYYAGEELDAEAYPDRLKFRRMLRGPSPEEGEDPDAETEKAELEKLKRVDSCWEQRLKEGDPLEAKCLIAKIEDEVEKWVQSQVVKHDDKKWANKLSSKLFMAEHFVLKHIRNKHADKVTEAREEIINKLYFENFKAAREAEQRRAREKNAKAAGTAAGGEEFFEEGPGFEGYEGEEEFHEGPFPGRGMRGRGRGRGMRGMGRRGPPIMHMDGPMMAAPMMGMPGPMLVPAPGAGPMGPFILAPMAPGGPMPMDMDMMHFGGGGGRRGRGGRGRGGRGFMAAPGAKLDPRGIREYYDLDAPSHNRAVLDYSDL